MKVYVVGSLRNEAPIEVERILTAAGYDAFSQWWSAGPKADDYWKEYFRSRGYTLSEALASPFVQHIVAFDRYHLLDSDAVVLAMPAGKSAHIELTWAYCHGKKCVIYMPDDSDRWDAMFALLPDLVIAHTEEQLLEALRGV